MRAGPLGLAAGLGAATALVGFAPLAFFPLPIVTLAWLLAQARRTENAGHAGLLGFSWGAGFFLAGVSWVHVSLHEVGGLALPLSLAATLLFCLYLALYPALATFVFRRWADGKADAALFAGLWTLSEWLRGTLLTGFPWLALGYAQTPPSPLSGFAPILGSYGLSFVSAWLAGHLACESRRWRALMLVALVCGLGFLLRGMSWTQPVGAPVTVALLQGNVPQDLKWRPERLSLSLETYRALAQQARAPLTILPETAIPLFFDRIPAAVLAELASEGELLLGAVVRHREGGYVNGAIAWHPSAPQVYAKRHLVPFGEYTPPGFSWFMRWVDIPLTDFSAGPTRQAPLQLAGQRVAPTICYEDLFGEELLTFFPQATLIVNLSNTAWFGDSLAQPQHLQIAQLRALETGRMLLSATNTGITAAIAPNGEVLAYLPAFQQGVLRIEAQGHGGATPFMRWGNDLALSLAIAAMLPALIRCWRRRRGR